MTLDGTRAPFDPGALVLSGEVQKRTGLSQRQLAYWDRTGLVKPTAQVGSGRGSRRLYGHVDLVLLSVAKRLLDAGLSLRGVRRAIRLLQRLTDKGYPLADVVVATDGRAVTLYKRVDMVIDLLDDPGWHYFPVRDVLEQVRPDAT